MMEGSGGEGLFAALKNLLATLVGIGKTRLELLSVELQEEKVRLLGLLVYALAAVFCGGVAVVLGVIWIAVAFWEQKVVVFGVFTLLFVAIAAILAGLAAQAAKRGSPVFRTSLAELQSDLLELRSETRQKPGSQA